MRKRTIMFALTLLALLSAASLLGACHTVAGMGEDVSDAGRNIQRDAGGR